MTKSKKNESKSQKNALIVIDGLLEQAWQLAYAARDTLAYDDWQELLSAIEKAQSRVPQS